MYKKWAPIPAMMLFILGCTQQSAEQISYKKDVKPIFDKYCISCHAEGGPGYRKAGIQLDTYEKIMQSRTIKPGDATKSPLLTVINPTADHSKAMPLRSEKLHKSQIDIIHNWIAQGAPNN